VLHTVIPPLELFSDDPLQHVSIERRVSRESFQLGILIAQLRQLAQFAQT